MTKELFIKWTCSLALETTHANRLGIHIHICTCRRSIYRNVYIVYIDIVSGGYNKSQHDIYLNKMLLFSFLCRLTRTTQPHCYSRIYVYVYVLRFLYSGTITQIMCFVDSVQKLIAMIELKSRSTWAQFPSNLFIYTIISSQTVIASRELIVFAWELQTGSKEVNE